MIGVAVLFSVAIVANARKSGNEHHRQYLEVSRADRAFLDRSLSEGILSVCKVSPEIADVRLGQNQQRIDGSGVVRTRDKQLYVRVGTTIAVVSVVHGHNTQTEPIEVTMRDCQ